MTGLPAIDAHCIDIARLAEEALWQELALTPKPGLVDKCNNGAHRDMDYLLFTRSIAAITPWFSRFVALGRKHAANPAIDQLRLIRTMGLACEQAMYTATGGVNTHKGAIFALGLLCVAAGRVQEITARSLCREVGAMCQGMVTRDFAVQGAIATAGVKQFWQYGLTGARGEAERGFATARHVLMHWDGQSLHELLLRLMAVNMDSNLVSRGGMSGLRYVQAYARRLLRQGWDRRALGVMDKALISKNLSPGGSADLFSVAWLLAQCD